MNANTAKTVAVDYVVKPLGAYIALSVLAGGIRRVSARKAAKKSTN